MKKEIFYKKPLKSLLFEQEEEAEEEGGEAEEEGGEAAEEAPAAEETPDDEKEGSSEVSDQTSIDSDIEAVLIDFETAARQSVVEEGNLSLQRLYEIADEIDLDGFTADVARLVKNYDNLLDIESLLVKKSKDFIEGKYGESAASEFVNKLETQHDIREPEEQKPLPTSSLETPLAVGASSAGE